MPRIITCASDEKISLAECIEAIGRQGFSLSDENQLHSAGLNLRKLGNDSDFLGDLLVEELANRHRDSTSDSAYGPQAIMLSDARQGFFLRANIWPSERDAIFAASGAHNFSYGTPHDHNFDFLTLGYFGPGYASDYYEYDFDTVSGFAGEKAGLRFVERSTLDRGKLMLYRAHRDVHSQLPPQSMSVSLNVMVIDPSQPWYDQYKFDVESDTITGVLNPTSTETFLRLAIGLGGGNALDLAEHFGKSHPSDRIRLASFEARSLLCQKREENEQLWREAERSGSLLLAYEAGARRKALA